MINPDNFIESLNEKPVALFGLGGSGMATLKWLRKSGIEVYAWDDRNEAHGAAEDIGAKLQKPLETSRGVLGACPFKSMR